MRKYFVLLALVSSSAAQAEATKGVVVYDKGCKDTVIIETSEGYVIAEWYGDAVPYDGDVIVGDLNSYGFKDLYIVNRDKSTRLWIDDYMLSKDRVVDKLLSKCPRT